MVARYRNPVAGLTRQGSERGTSIRPAPGPGNSVKLASVDEVLPFILDVERRFGDVVHIESDLGSSYLLTRPDLVEFVLHKPGFTRTRTALRLVTGDGILASSGDYWRQQRGLMQPRLKRGNLLQFAPLIQEHAGALLDRWQRKAEDGSPIDVTAEMHRITLEIITDAFFSCRISNYVEEIYEAISVVSRGIGQYMAMRFNFPMRVGPEFKTGFFGATKVIDDFVYGLIDERRRQKEMPDDLLTLLIGARSGSDARSLSDRQIRDEVVTLLIAGHETSAKVLTWALYLLAHDPESIAKILGELSRMPNSGIPGNVDTPELEFTKMVILESMRLYPPVWLLTRTSIDECEIDGYRIPANSSILVSAFVTQRRSDLWPEPEQFIPQRFAAENRLERPRYAYFPFGGGRHTCPGEPLAMMEITQVLSAILQRFVLHPPMLPAEPTIALTLQPKDKFLMDVSVRDQDGSFGY